MFNSNSPIVNNTMLGGNGGIYPTNGYIPPNPIGNIMNIGNMGYNNMGGYYSNNYNYYNPYLAAKQQEIEEARMREMQRQQCDVTKLIFSKASAASGIEVTEDQLQRFDVQYVQQTNNEQNEYNRLLNIHMQGNQNNTTITDKYVQSHNNLYEQSRKDISDDMTLFEFFEYADENQLVNKAIQQNNSKQVNDLSKLYDTNGYNKLIKMHSGSSSYFNSMFNKDYNPNTSIDDMTIALPNHLANEHNERRKAFINSIINGGV